MLLYGTEFWSRDIMTCGKLINRSGDSLGLSDTLEMRDYSPPEVREGSPRLKRCVKSDALGYLGGQNCQ
jgi:hypothetical protein